MSDLHDLVPDPFDALRAVDTPVAPSARFTADLRTRLDTALAQSPSIPASPSPATTITTSSTTTTQEASVPQTIAVYLSVRNASAALDFYRDAFAGIETQRLVGDDGRVGHAEITVGNSTLSLADEYPEMDIVGPETRGGATCSFQLQVADVDATYATAVSLGATSQREPADQFHGNRSATIVDPFGHRWMIMAPIETLSTEEYASRAADGGFELQTTGDAGSTEPHHQAKRLAHGDLYYFSVPAPDAAKAQRFFGAVLGWQFGQGSGHIENISAPPGSVGGDPSVVGPQLWFVVDDIRTAVAAVIEHGGTASEPVEYESGWAADCTDDQGTAFSLSVPSAEYSL